MKLMDIETNREFAPIWIDANNNLIVTTELANNKFDSVIVMHPCGMGTMYRKLLGTKEREEWH